MRAEFGKRRAGERIRVYYPLKDRDSPALLSLDLGLSEARYSGGCGLIREHVTESKACWEEGKQHKRRVVPQ